jgi:hypothetical protein
MSDKETEKPWLFKPGQSGNHAGRPKGAKNKLSGDFIQALQDSFNTDGASAVAKLALESPGEYLRVIASVLPKDIQVEIDEVRSVINAQPEMTTEEWQKTYGQSGDHKQGHKPH